MELIDWKMVDFRAWLEGQPPDAIVGTTNHWTSCPLANWRKTFGEECAVGCDTTTRTDLPQEFELPEWAHLFVHGLDDRHVAEDDEFTYLQEPVTAGECLQVLKENEPYV